MAATATIPPIPQDAKPDLAKVIRDIHALWARDTTPYPYADLLCQDPALQRAPYYVYDRSQAVHIPGGGHYFPAVPKNRQLLIIDYAALHHRLANATDPADIQHARTTLAFTERLQDALARMNRDFPFLMRYYTVNGSTPFINPLPQELHDLRVLAQEAREAFAQLKRYPSGQPQEEPMWFVYNQLHSLTEPAAETNSVIYHSLLLLEYLQNVQAVHYKLLSP